MFIMTEMTIIIQPHDHYVQVTWPSYPSHMIIISKSHDPLGFVMLLVSFDLSFMRHKFISNKIMHSQNFKMLQSMVNQTTLNHVTQQQPGDKVHNQQIQDSPVLYIQTELEKVIQLFYLLVPSWKHTLWIWKIQIHWDCWQ